MMYLNLTLKGRGYRQTVEKYGKIDILVNSAGIGMREKAENMSEKQWDKVLDVNLKGSFLFCREAGCEMIKRGQGGRIINIASVAGIVGLETGNANYSASKGGQMAMTRCLAIEWAKYGILVNVIAPTHIRTPLVEKLMEEKPEVKQYFLNNIPLGRLGKARGYCGICRISCFGGFPLHNRSHVDGRRWAYCKVKIDFAVVQIQQGVKTDSILMVIKISLSQSWRTQITF